MQIVHYVCKYAKKCVKRAEALLKINIPCHVLHFILFAYIITNYHKI